MKKSLIITIGLFIIMIGVLMWWFSDTQVIKRQTQELANVLTIATVDGKTSRAARNQNFKSLLSKDASCTVDVKSYQGEFTRDDLIAAHHALVHTCKTANASASDVTITAINDTSATVTAKLAISVTEKNGNHHSETCQADLRWQKNDQGKWKLDSILILQSLNRP